MAGSHIQTPFKSCLFAGFCMRNCINCFHNCQDHSLLDFTSAVQLWNISYYNFTFIPHRLLRTHKEAAPNITGFIAQLVRPSHWYHQVISSNPVKVLTFAGFYRRKWINCFHNCKDHSLLDFTSAVQYLKYFMYNFTFIPQWLLRTHKWPAPNVSGFIGQLVRVSHRYHEVMGSNPVEALTISGFYILKCINCVHNWEDNSLLDDLFYISFHHSNWFIVGLLSQQILRVLSPFCYHSSASPTWPVAFLYDPMFF